MIAVLHSVGRWLIGTTWGRAVLLVLAGALAAAWWIRRPVSVVTSASTATATSATAKSEKRTAVSTAQADLETVGGETVIEFDSAGHPTRIAHKGGTLRMNLKTSASVSADLALTQTVTSTATTSTSAPAQATQRAGGWGIGAAVLLPLHDRSWGCSPEVSYGIGALDLPLVGEKRVSAFLGFDVPFGSYLPDAGRLGIRAGP